jgi:hypothetical protein
LPNISGFIYSAAFEVRSTNRREKSLVLTYVMCHAFTQLSGALHLPATLFTALPMAQTLEPIEAMLPENITIDQIRDS